MTFSIKDTVDGAFFLGSLTVICALFQTYRANLELFTIVSSHYTRMVDTKSLSVRDRIFIEIDRFDSAIKTVLDAHRKTEREHILQWRTYMSEHCPAFSDMSALPNIDAKNAQLKINNDERMKVNTQIANIQKTVHTELGNLRSLIIYLKPSSYETYEKILKIVDYIRDTVEPIDDLIKKEIALREKVQCGLQLANLEIDYSARNMAHLTVFGVDTNG